MVTETRLETMHQMRQSPATLQQIASPFGVSREAVRKLLARHYGSTRIGNLLTITELARLAGCTPSYIRKLRRRGIIQPARVVGRGRTLWEPETIAAIIIYIDHHRCPVCNGPLSSNRWVYCCDACYISDMKKAKQIG